jgi:calcineurin-like phosphoesterase family protein
MIEGLYDIFEHWHKDRQTVWIYSDTHFNDEGLAAGVASRPSAEEHLKLINSKVGKKDTLILLGDVGDIEIARKLKGYKILIAGNHDAGMSKYKEVFDEVYAGALIVSEKLILSHEPVDCPWAFNIHGHVHSGGPMSDERHLNVCGEARGCYEPINFNQFMKAGFMAKIQTIHRDTIDKATKRARKREKRNGK